MASYIEKVEKLTLPVIAVRGIVIFPQIPVSFELSRQESILAMQAASSFGGNVFFTLQINNEITRPSLENTEKIGCVAEIKHATKLANGNYRVIIEGKYRGEIAEKIQNTPYLRAVIFTKNIQLKDKNNVESEVHMRAVKKCFERYISFIPKVSPELVTAVQSINSPSLLADFIASNILHNLSDKQGILSENDPIRRLEALEILMEHETEMIRLELEIHGITKNELEKRQRIMYLREQYDVIKRELGMLCDTVENADADDEPVKYPELAELINSSECSDDVKYILYNELHKLDNMPPISSEASVITEYIETVTSLPWKSKTKDRFDVEKAKKILDDEHDALYKVKERILEYISVKQLAPNLKGQILLLVGPPGVGKTSIAKSVAHALNRKFVRVSLGGVRDEADIRGHRKTYVAAMPGRIITAFKQVKKANPVMLLDEIDKMTANSHGDPAAALLEVLDVDQNVEFRDHYIEIPFDISDCIFIATANTLDTVPRPLLDRMEIINLPAYSLTEKISIFKNHLFPRELKNHGLNKSKLHIKDDAITEIIEHYTKESGVRNLERETASICRKVARKLVESEKKSYTINKADVVEYLGTPKIHETNIDIDAKTGVVNGLAWTELGGELLQVEVLSMPGNGKLEITGSLGDVMKESARAAVSYIRKNAEKLEIKSDFYKNTDIHIHFPEGAVPKDGPSAGVTMVTALVSELSSRKVRGDVAMTGEITLTGRVLPIGGLREKTMAAYKHGIKTVIIPYENKIDLEECDKQVLENINFIYASDISTVLENAVI